MDSPEEQQPTEMNPPAPPRSSGSPRRRGRRGGRGRGRGRGPRPPAQTGQTGQPAGAVAEGPAAPELEIPSGGEGRKDAPGINRAIEEVRQIVESLEQVLEQMEEVRELVELVERQKSADEHEIESLRRALRRVHQPRGGQPNSPAHND